jgi:hypothetical protein
MHLILHRCAGGQNIGVYHVDFLGFTLLGPEQSGSVKPDAAACITLIHEQRQTVIRRDLHLMHFITVIRTFHANIIS